jgi:hypothetical protein
MSFLGCSGTLLMHSETELILKSHRVVPSRLLQEGFTFQFPSWPKADCDLCCRWREISAGAQHQ